MLFSEKKYNERIFCIPAPRKGFKFVPNTKRSFNPAEFVPFKDREVCERVRNMSGAELEKREAWWHPEFQVKVMMNPHPVLIATLFSRLKAASEAGKPFSMVLGSGTRNLHPAGTADQLLPG